MKEYLKITNEDNMELMKRFPDNYFDLAIVDPPYGIGGGSNTKKMNVEWDSTTPDKSYFIELCRVSKNQIIWGANYMSAKIPFNSTHTIIWDKENGDSFMSDGEVAFTSFKKQTTKFFRLFWMSNMMKAKEKPLIHPTQKPIQMYEWLLKTYAKENDKILDTHLGSGSIAIAVDIVNKIEKMNLTLTACELDKEYYETATKRIEEQTNWQSLF